MCGGYPNWLIFTLEKVWVHVSSSETKSSSKVPHNLEDRRRDSFAVEQAVQCPQWHLNLDGHRPDCTRTKMVNTRRYVAMLLDC
jgi:hypothetical protein